jgi:quercetin dioxygenase-like cupin family protein
VSGPRILRPDTLPLRDRGGGVASIPLVTRATGARDFVNSMTIIAPGAAVPRHWHNCDESVLVIEGHPVAEIDGVEHDLRPGDVSFIPAGKPHGFRNASTRDAVRIFWTYASVDADRTIEATGDCRPIDTEYLT